MEFFSYQGEKCRLRPIKMEDLLQSVIWRNDPEVRDNIQGFRYPVSEEMESKWLKSFIETSGTDRAGFAIEDLKDNGLVGFVFLNNIDLINKQAKLGTVLGNREKWGFGFGTESSKLICDYGMKMLGLHRIWVEILSDNKASIRMCEKIGFVQEGMMKDHFFTNNKFHDVVFMGLING